MERLGGGVGLAGLRLLGEGGQRRAADVEIGRVAHRADGGGADVDVRVALGDLHQLVERSLRADVTNLLYAGRALRVGLLALALEALLEVLEGRRGLRALDARCRVVLVDPRARLRGRHGLRTPELDGMPGAADDVRGPAFVANPERHARLDLLRGVAQDLVALIPVEVDVHTIPLVIECGVEAVVADGAVPQAAAEHDGAAPRDAGIHRHVVRAIGRDVREEQRDRHGDRLVLVRREDRLRAAPVRAGALHRELLLVLQVAVEVVVHPEARVVLVGVEREEQPLLGTRHADARIASCPQIGQRLHAGRRIRLERNATGARRAHRARLPCEMHGEDVLLRTQGRGGGQENEREADESQDPVHRGSLPKACLHGIGPGRIRPCFPALAARSA